MRPLQSIAMGLVVVTLHAAFRGYDALPDPLGWVLVLLGARHLPEDLHRRSFVVGAAVLALLVSLPLWVPGLTEAVDDVHPSLTWAANLPQLAFAGLLADGLARQAARQGDRRASAWLRTEATGFVVVALLPVLVFGGGLDGLENLTYLAAGMVLLLLIWLLFAYASRPWAPSPPLPTEPGTT